MDLLVVLGWVVEHDLLLGGGGCVIQIRGSGEGVALRGGRGAMLCVTMVLVLGVLHCESMTVVVIGGCLGGDVWLRKRVMMWK